MSVGAATGLDILLSIMPVLTSFCRLKCSLFVKYELMYSASALPGSAFISCIFLSPPALTKRRLALASFGRTLLNWPTTCFRMLGGASWSRGSRAGRKTHFWSKFLSAFLDYNKTSMGVYYTRRIINSTYSMGGSRLRTASLDTDIYTRNVNRKPRFSIPVNPDTSLR
jgi:hypothetical protein